MPVVDVVVHSKNSNSIRARQVSSMFDVPISEDTTLSWRGDMPIEDKPWNVGLIVGPSGCGKSTVGRNLFGADYSFEYDKASVIDDFSGENDIKTISEVCQAVGFNTIPAWLRPYAVLSNGEKFRVDVARTLLEDKRQIITIDEFTSVVDRQVAQIGSHAVQKFVRRNNKKFVAISCHYDIIDWLQPDWIFEPATMSFQWRLLRRRPEIACTIQRVKYEAWDIFSRYHYLSADLNKAARCFGLFIGDKLVSFAGVLHRAGSTVKGLSRLVTLPDYQGLGLAMILTEYIASAYVSLGFGFNTYPAHPALVKSFSKSTKWKQEKKAGTYQVFSRGFIGPAFGGRPNATFSYCGPKMDRNEAMRLVQ
jgi:hypothetical protein